MLLDELDMVVVTAADPFLRQQDGESWQHEEGTINLVAELIESPPSELPPPSRQRSRAADARRRQW